LELSCGCEMIGLVEGGIDQKVIERVTLRNLDASSVSAKSEVKCNKEARRQSQLGMLLIPSLTA
jgi:hypothetical protein